MTEEKNEKIRSPKCAWIRNDNDIIHVWHTARSACPTHPVTDTPNIGGHSRLSSDRNSANEDTTVKQPRHTQTPPNANYMCQSSSQEAHSSSAIQDVPLLFTEPNTVHHRIHNSPSLPPRQTIITTQSTAWTRHTTTADVTVTHRLTGTWTRRRHDKSPFGRRTATHLYL